ncbi:hypothetical protein ACIQCM_08765 [Pseudarthrobacter sp. NPDC092439]|uniref:hypothetical protein n=1 Tax=unclassified Pseudarthrobacter TaxID=2647000 RepID=UPI0037F1B2D4
MNTTNRLKQLLAAKVETLPITDKAGTLVGFADMKLFLSDGLRLAARISLANGDETPIKKHCQTLYHRRGADDYAKGYVRTVWETQEGFFKGTLAMLMDKTGDLRQGYVDGFDNEAVMP